MGAAVDIGVIREHVLGFLSVRGGLRLLEADLFCRRSALLVWSAAAEAIPEASDDFVGEICLCEEVAARYQRNHLAKIRFNYERSGKGLLLFFLDNLKSLKNKSEIY
jgi:hypothetical protein